MTTKKNAVKKTAVVKPYVATRADIDLAASAGLNMRNGESAKQAVEKAVAELRAHNAVIGDARNCPLAQAFIDKRYPMGKKLNGEKVSKGTISNALNAFRDAVNKGKAYDENKNRKTGAASKKAGKKTGAKTGGSGNILISIGKGSAAQDAADKLRKGFNAMKAANDGLANLAAYMLDALDDAGFAEKLAK